MQRLFFMVMAYIRFLIFYVLFAFLPTIVFFIVLVLAFQLFPVDSSFGAADLGAFIAIFGGLPCVILGHLLCIRIFLPRFFPNAWYCTWLVILHGLIIFIFTPVILSYRADLEYNKKAELQEQLWRKHADRYLNTVIFSDFQERLLEPVAGEKFRRLEIATTLDVKEEGEYKFEEFYLTCARCSLNYGIVFDRVSYPIPTPYTVFIPVHLLSGKNQFSFQFVFTSFSFPYNLDKSKPNQTNFTLVYSFERLGQVPEYRYENLISKNPKTTSGTYDVVRNGRWMSRVYKESDLIIQ